MVSEKELLAQRHRLKEAHQALELELKKLLTEPIVNQMKIQRLKKEKLYIKDQINQIESELFPDIIA